MLNLALPRPAAAAASRIEVVNGASPRAAVLLSVPTPAGFAATGMRGADGQVLPLQRSGDRLWFSVPELAAGTQAFEVVSGEASNAVSESRPWLREAPGRLALGVGAMPVLQYFAGPGERPRADIREIFQRGGYVHPLQTPSGRVVTDDYPTNHTHHHGFWTAWTKTKYAGQTPDFWNMGDQKGRVDFIRLEATESGPVFAGFTARHDYTDLMSEPDRVALHELWRLRVLPTRPGVAWSLFDLEIEQQVAGEQALELPTYHYGGLGYRGPGAWNGKEKLRYLDSNGETNRVKAHGTRARWYWAGGQVGGALAGVVVFGHPANFRAPQPLRVHPDEPFLCWAPSQLGDWSIRPGETYRARYLVAALDGEPNPKEIEALWQNYAEPPTARWVGE